ncbi:MAG TPA: 50S ribosomal protein L11 methyltransferase [Candidatus Acidoferrum sp.]|nr:50S ribosomal protein L11 methyltransferase [Candidatus Acidoferrum sp.]
MAVSLHDNDKPPLRIRVNSKHVMTPSSLTCLLAENLDVPKGSVVADLGCGCGILSIIAAKLGAKFVYAVDMNPHAISDTNFNATINGVSSIVRPVLCDIKSSLVLERKVDVVISNPPQMPVKYQARTRKWLSISRDGGVTGRAFLKTIVEQSPRLFREKQSSAKLEIVTTSLLGIRATLNYLEKHGFSPSIVANSLTPIAFKRSSTKDRSTRICDLAYVRSVVLHATYNRSHRGGSSPNNS